LDERAERAVEDDDLLVDPAQIITCGHTTQHAIGHAGSVALT
jgi:hypothetical protein